MSLEVQIRSNLLNLIAVHGAGGFLEVVCVPIFAKSESIIFGTNKIAAVVSNRTEELPSNKILRN